MKNSDLTIKWVTIFLVFFFIWENSQFLNAQSAGENQKAMIVDYIEAMNRGDESFLEEYLGRNYVHHSANGDLNRDEFKQFHHMALTAFPDAVMKAEDILVDNDKTVTRWRLTGTHKGTFNGIPASNKPVNITGIIISRFEDGRVVEEWEEANLIGFLQQIGLISLPEGE